MKRIGPNHGPRERMQMVWVYVVRNKFVSEDLQSCDGIFVLQQLQILLLADKEPRLLRAIGWMRLRKDSRATAEHTIKLSSSVTPRRINAASACSHDAPNT
jgi:hypothetical protein